MCLAATRPIWVESAPVTFESLIPEEKIMVMSHLYMEDYVVLLTRSVIRAEDRMVDDAQLPGSMWLSARLIWCLRVQAW